jgi:hypothetical protein
MPYDRKSPSDASGAEKDLTAVKGAPQLRHVTAVQGAARADYTGAKLLRR